jgi:hypothetical protein
MSLQPEDVTLDAGMPVPANLSNSASQRGEQQDPLAQLQGAAAIDSSTMEGAHGHQQQKSLRILSGVHLGAEVPIRSERLLIGNLDAECDIVIDVGTAEKHLCLLRVSDDGWTVLGIAGDVWVGSDYVEPRQMRPFSPCEAITIGRVALMVGSGDEAEWANVRPPSALIRPEAAGPMPVATAPPMRSLHMARWNAARMISGLGLGVLIAAAGLAYATGAASTAHPSGLEDARQRLDVARALLSTLPFANEIRIDPDPQLPGQLVVRGFVPEQAQLQSLEMKLADVRSFSSFRVHASSELQAVLERRLAPIQPVKVTYLGGGGYGVSLSGALLQRMDGSLRAAMQDFQTVTYIRASLEDVTGEDGKPIAAVYRRSPDRPGELIVEGESLLKQPPPSYLVKEVRTGLLPSVVLENGTHYFAGARLPDGWTLETIDSNGLTVRLGEWRRSVKIGVPADAKK